MKELENQQALQRHRDKAAKVEQLRQEAIREAEANPKKGGLTIPKWFWRPKS